MWRILTIGLFIECCLAVACPRASLAQFTPSATKQTSAIAGEWNAVRPKTLYRMSDQGRAPAEMLTLVTLQGLLARSEFEHASGPENLYFASGSNGYDLWLEILGREYGVETRETNRPWEFVERHAEVPAGYVLCDMDDEASKNVATSMAGALNAVVVDVSLEPRAMQLGWERLADARGRKVVEDDQLQREPRQRPMLILQRSELPWQLRDLAVLAEAEVLSSSHLPALEKRMMEIGREPKIVWGWGDNALEHEDQFISRVSQFGGAMIPTDHARNLSVLAGFGESRTLAQKPPVAEHVTPDGPVHTVTFIFTDGDNLGWLLSLFPVSPQWYASDERGRVPLGWGMAPSLAEIFPAAVNWYYRTASDAPTARDVFIAGPSGAGYFFPSRLPAAALEEQCRRTASAMRRADLGIAQVIDFDSLDRLALWDQYTQHADIDGVVYLDYSAYDKEAGRIVWSNGKPVVSASARLWKDLPGCDPDSVVRRLESAPRRPDAPEGYSIVMVHAWSHSVADVVAVAERLPAEVEVVAPDTFFRRLSSEIPPEARRK